MTNFDLAAGTPMACATGAAAVLSAAATVLYLQMGPILMLRPVTSLCRNL